MKYIFVILGLILGALAKAEDIKFNPILDAGFGYVASNDRPQSVSYGETLLVGYLLQTEEKAIPLNFHVLGVGTAFSDYEADILLSPIALMYNNLIGVSYNYHLVHNQNGFSILVHF